MAEICSMKFYAYKIKSTMFILLLFVGFSNSLKAQEMLKDSISLSLQQAWDRANTYSKELQLKKYDSQIGEEDILDAKKEWLPKLGVDGSYGQLSNIPVFTDGINHSADYIHLDDHATYEARIGAQFNLYNGGKTKLHVKKAQTKQDLLKYLEEESTSQIHYKVAEAYLEVQQSMAFKKLIKKNIYRNDKLLDQITKLYNNGVVLKSDLLRAKLQLSRQETHLLEMKNNVELANQSLNILVGYPDEQPITPTDSIEVNLLKSAKNHKAYVQDAIENSSQEQLAKKQVKIKKLQEKEVNANKLPKLSLFGEYTYSYPQIKLYPYETAPYLIGMVGVKVSYDISNLYHNKHKETAAKIAVEKQQTAKNHLEDGLRHQVTTAYKHFHEDLKKIEVAKMNIEQAEENYRIVNQTYFNQLSLLTDLLDADNQLLQAKFELVDSQISSRIHYYQLLKITGQL